MTKPLIARITPKVEYNPDTFEHVKYIIEKELNSEFIKVEIIKEEVCN